MNQSGVRWGVRLDGRKMNTVVTFVVAKEVNPNR